MVHQETAFLNIWINYYAPIVGRENLYVLTHGHNDAVAALLDGCRTIFVPRNVVDWRFDKLRFALLNVYGNTLLANYDGIIAGDVDEIVFVDPALHDSLHDVLAAHCDKPVLTPFGFNVCEVDGDAPFDASKTVLAQRKVAFADQLYSKPLIAFSEPGWSKGYHASAHQPCFVEGLYMAHLKFAFESIVQDVSAERRRTAQFNHNLGERSRERYWTKGDLIFRRMKRYVSQLSKHAFDSAVDAQVENLSRNVVSNQSGRTGFSCAFTQEVQAMILPTRFESLL
jgi:hypothetical protein